MKTTVEITDSLFHQAKTLAAKEGLNFRVLVEDGLRLVLEARRQTKAAPFRLRDGSFKGGNGLQPGVKWADLPSLAYDEEGSSLRS